MDDLFGWIVKRTAEQWSAIGTMITAFVAIAATIFAWQQVRHARKLREEQARPFVVIHFRPHPRIGHWMNLIVENTGSTLARNVRITFDKPLETSTQRPEVADLKIFREGIPVMPPGMRFETLFDSTPDRKSRSLPMVYRATVSYDGVRGKRETEEYVLDFELFFGLWYVTEYGIHDAAKSLREMNKTLKAWSRSGRLRVSVTDEDYRSDADITFDSGDE